MATMNGVVGQYITPKDEVNNKIGLRSRFKSGPIGDQKAKTTKGTTPYLQTGSLRKTYSFLGLKTSNIQKRPTMNIGTKLPVTIKSIVLGCSYVVADSHKQYQKTEISIRDPTYLPSIEVNGNKQQNSEYMNRWAEPRVCG